MTTISPFGITPMLEPQPIVYSGRNTPRRSLYKSLTNAKQSDSKVMPVQEAVILVCRSRRPVQPLPLRDS